LRPVLITAEPAYCGASFREQHRLLQLIFNLALAQACRLLSVPIGPHRALAAVWRLRSDTMCRATVSGTAVVGMSASGSRVSGAVDGNRRNPITPATIRSRMPSTLKRTAPARPVPRASRRMARPPQLRCRRGPQAVQRRPTDSPAPSRSGTAPPRSATCAVGRGAGVSGSARIREMSGIRVASRSEIRVPASATGNQGTLSPTSKWYTPARERAADYDPAAQHGGGCGGDGGYLPTADACSDGAAVQHCAGGCRHPDRTGQDRRPHIVW
jgi:hypothetical protein